MFGSSVALGPIPNGLPTLMIGRRLLIAWSNGGVTRYGSPFLHRS
jgi:hypothetical protein